MVLVVSIKKQIIVLVIFKKLNSKYALCKRAYVTVYHLQIQLVQQGIEEDITTYINHCVELYAYEDEIQQA